MCQFMKTFALAIFVFVAANVPSAQMLTQHIHDVSYSYMNSSLHLRSMDDAHHSGPPFFSEINTSALIAAGIGLLGLRLRRRN